MARRRKGPSVSKKYAWSRIAAGIACPILWSLAGFVHSDEGMRGSTGWAVAGTDSVVLTSLGSCTMLPPDAMGVRKGLCGDKVEDKAYAQAAEHPLSVSPAAALDIRFDSPPLRTRANQDRAAAGAWTDSTARVQAPTIPGVVNYRVEAKWADHSGTWLFQIRIRER